MPSAQSKMRLLVVGAFVAGLSVGLAIVGASNRRVGFRDVPPPKAAPGTMEDGVARVGDSWITRDEFKAAWERRSTEARELTRASVLEDLVRRALVFEEARQTGFDRSEAMREAWKSLVVARFEEARESRQQHPTDFSEAQIETYYREHADRYTVSERRRLEVVHQPMLPGATAGQRERLTRLLGSLRDDVASRPEARDLSRLVDGFAASEGRRLNRQTAGWLTRDQAARAWPVAVVEASFQLRQPGETSAVLETDEGWYVLRLVGLQPPHAPALETVKDRVRYDMARLANAEQDARFFEDLRQRHAIQTFDEVLESVAPDRPALVQQPPRFPNR
jgi:peptidyl-prolyl cis-trans isomerase C